jgi:BirA family transcriptional regulator, biotin operon repressor / biotin---[acetyl-CoA-carboxylase] ligase
VISLKPFKRIHLAECSSTNLVANEMHGRGEDITNTIISTDYQTSGKGLDTNSWHSERGKNLLFSLVIKPEGLEASAQFMLTKAVSLGVHDVLIQVLPAEVLTIKWPNDIYVDNKKICGMLISNHIGGNKILLSTIGIGLNVNQTIFPSELPNPVSVKQLIGMNTDRDWLLDKLSMSIAQRLTSIFSKARDSLDQDYLQSLYQFQQWHKYESEGKMFTARIISVNHFGHLVLELETGETWNYDIKNLIFKESKCSST